jgi:hypothetical protein
MMTASQRYSELVGVGDQIMGMYRSELKTDEAGPFGGWAENSNPG